MEEKKIEKDQEIVNKKIYTFPALILYGKLIELTTGGSKGPTEGAVIDLTKPNKQRP